MSYDSYASKARREAFSLVPETCPEIDRALKAVTEAVDSLDTIIKERGTEKLREALIEKCADALRAEDRVEELEAELEALKSRLCPECAR